MATYTRTTEVQTIERTIYELPASTNWSEVAKVLEACRQEMSGKPTFDDSVRVEADEDSIKFIIAHSDTRTTQ